MEANAGKSFQMQILFNIFPRISLHCKLVPVQSSTGNTNVVYYNPLNVVLAEPKVFGCISLIPNNENRVGVY